ncbi:MAG: hypothetical protein EBS09_03140 [Flavobacteriia bacterium]|nr:hypothetical protein [Flavobacteriia bacterium]
MDFWRYAFIFLSCLVFLPSCDSNSYDVDVSDVQLGLTFYNTDSLLSHARPGDYVKTRNVLMQQDQEITRYLFGYCYGIRLKPDVQFQQEVQSYYSNAYIQKLEKEIATKFKGEKRKEAGLKTAFLHLKYHFPKGKFPSKIHYVNSRFTASVFCTETSVAIGLERYLGAKNPCIKELPNQPFYSWIKEGMEADYLQRDVVLGWLSTHYIAETNENFASEMIRWGKLLFITKACLPDHPEHSLFRYTKKDHQYAITHERALWQFLIDEQLLYNSGEDPKQSLLKDGPFSMGLPAESPDRMGQFLGYQIVSQYMEDNDVSLKQLINTPYLKILQSYKPKKK